MALSAAALAQSVSDDARSQSSANKTLDQPKPDNSPLVLDAIRTAVESIAASLLAQNDEASARRKEQHEAADLESQREQALWAKWMFVTATAQTVLTFIGIVLLLRTLKYTKDAAVAAKAMVDEAKSATHAATSATREAKRQADFAEESFRRLERPYILPGEVSKVSWQHRTSGAAVYFVACSIGNYGRSPAIIHYIRASFGPGPLNHTSDPDSPVKSMENTFNSGKVVSANTVDEEPFKAFLPAVVIVDHNQNHALSIEGHANVFFVINTKFEDVLGTIREGRLTWRYDKARLQFLRYPGKEYNYEREIPAGSVDPES